MGGNKYFDVFGRWLQQLSHTHVKEAASFACSSLHGETTLFYRHEKGVCDL
jgi:hypothetical protein